MEGVTAQKSVSIIWTAAVNTFHKLFHLKIFGSVHGLEQRDLELDNIHVKIIFLASDFHKKMHNFIRLVKLPRLIDLKYWVRFVV